MTAIPDKLYTINEAVKIAHVCERTLYHHMTRKTLKRVKRGDGRVFIRGAELQRWMDARMALVEVAA